MRKLRPSFILFILVVSALIIPTIVIAAEMNNATAEEKQIQEHEENCYILEGFEDTFIETKPVVPDFPVDVTVGNVNVPDETVEKEESMETTEFEKQEMVIEDVLDETETVEENENVETTEKPKWNGEVLTCKKGYVECGPTGYETWYDLGMSVVVKNMREKHGIDLEYWIDEETGLKMYGEYIMVAADVRSPANPDGIFEYGDIIEVSHGKAMVVDCCRLAINKRKYSGEIHIDVATDWAHTYSIRN